MRGYRAKMLHLQKFSHRTFITLAGFIGLIMFSSSVLALQGEGNGPRDTTWERIQKQRVIVVGVDPSFPPFGIYDPAGAQGIDADVARELAEIFGVDVRFHLITYDGMYDSLYRGDVDMIIAALRPDAGLLERFRYTRPYYDAGHVFVGRRGELLPQKFSDLAGKTLAVEFASEGDETARRALDAGNTEFQLERALSVDEAIQALMDGTADYALVDSVSARLAAREHPELSVAVQPILPDPYVIAIRRSDWQLFLMIEKALEDHQADFEQIIARWL